MKFQKFFKVTSYEDILEQIAAFPHVEKETVPLENCLNRVLPLLYRDFLLVSCVKR